MKKAHGNVPADIKGWNWGAFRYTWIWGIANKTYWPLLTLIPVFGLGWAFVVGFKGNEWAWTTYQGDLNTFKAIQSTWNRAGIAGLLATLLTWGYTLWNILHLLHI
ncbi:hypothetical protein, partial [Lactiplantibacillus garii]|uniref:hypothetical protein n=1 Tax=Lactiplantibacillus garii TaxID=2306423 RepID=UPI001CDB6B5A